MLKVILQIYDLSFWDLLFFSTPSARGVGLVFFFSRAGLVLFFFFAGQGTSDLSSPRRTGTTVA